MNRTHSSASSTQGALLALLLGLAAGSAGACAASNDTDSNDPAGSGGAPPTTSSAAGGADPICVEKPDITPVCNQNGAPALCNDEQAVQQSPSCSNTGSFCQDGFCTCNPGDIVCIDNAVMECQLGATPGQNIYLLKEQCDSAAHSFCVAGTAGTPNVGCVAEIPCANVNQLFCDKDGNTVVRCQKDAGGFYEAVPVLKCHENGYANGCIMISTGETDPDMLCMNACNTRGVPLSGELCGDASLFCAVNVCNIAGTALVPDHTDCRPPGASCELDSDCASCSCLNGACFGDQGQINVCEPYDDVCED